MLVISCGCSADDSHETFKTLGSVVIENKQYVVLAYISYFKIVFSIASTLMANCFCVMYSKNNCDIATITKCFITQ